MGTNRREPELSSDRVSLEDTRKWLAEPRLTFIWYVDPSKTKVMTVRLKALYWSGAVTVVAVGLALFAMIWLPRPVASIQRVEPVSTVLAATDTHPAKQTQPLVQSTTPDASEPAAASPTSEQQASPKSSDVAIDAPSISPGDGHLLVQFGLRNLTKAQLKGSVWGSARFETAEGKIIQVGSPQVINGADLMAPSNHELGTRFSAVTLSRKTLSFYAPTGIKGHFTKVQLAVWLGQSAGGFKVGEIDVPQTP